MWREVAAERGVWGTLAQANLLDTRAKNFINLTIHVPFRSINAYAVSVYRCTPFQ
jgi:hypothetical protein